MFTDNSAFEAFILNLRSKEHTISDNMTQLAFLFLCVRFWWKMFSNFVLFIHSFSDVYVYRVQCSSAVFKIVLYYLFLFELDIQF